MHVWVRPRRHTHTERGLWFPPQYHNLNLQHSQEPKKGTQIYMQKKNAQKPLVREPPSMFPQPGSLWREMLCLQSQWFIYSFISVRVSKKELSHKMRGKHTLTIHADRRPTYNGVRPVSPRWSFMTLLSLPQCHAAFSTICSTLAWVDQSPVSQHVIITLNRIYRPHLLPPPTWPIVE